MIKTIFYPFIYLTAYLHKEVTRWRYYTYFLSDKSYFSGIETISIGNLQMGGGGKTPLVIKLLKHFNKMGIEFIHSTRAYKSKAESKGLILNLPTDGNVWQNPVMVGDEPSMVMKNIKKGTFVLGKRRSKLLQDLSLENLKNKTYEVLVLEDAYQHFKIERNIDVLLIDVTCKLEDFKTFPLGPLREDIKELWRADYIILNKVNQTSESELLKWREFVSNHKRETSLVNELEYLGQSIINLENEQELNLKDHKNKNVILCSAIANPASFESLIISMGFNVVKSFHLPDHSAFSKNKMTTILDYSTQNDAIVICTEKDAGKLKLTLSSDRIYYVKLEIRLSHEGEGPWNWLTNIIRRY